MDQWQLEELAKLRHEAKVTVVGDGLSGETLNGLFVESAPGVEEAVRDSLAAIPKGPYVLARFA